MKARPLVYASVAVLLSSTMVLMRPTPHSESVRQGEAQNTFREHLTNLRAAEMSRARKQQIVANYGQAPLSFEANRARPIRR